MRIRDIGIPLALIGLTLGAECTEPIMIPDADAPPSVDVRPDALSLHAGQVAQLEAIVTNATDPAVTWSSSSEDIATVDADGTVTAVGSGIATVVARSNEDPNAVDAAAISVSSVTVEISPASVTLQPGEEAALACTLRNDETGAVITGYGFEWVSSAPQVAEVAADGTVTAVAAGTADVSCEVTLGGADVEASATVSVTTPPSDPCGEFRLRVDFDPVQVAPGGSGVLAVFVDRVGAFTGTVEVMLAAGAGGTQPFDVMSSAEFDPGLVSFPNDPNAPDTRTAMLYFGVRPDVTPGSSYELSIVGGSPRLENDPDWCRLPVSFEIIG